MVFASSVTKNVIKTPRQLYKHLLKTCEKLPKDAQNFYKHSIRQSFRQHEFEPDPERVKQIIDKSVQDAEWVLKKLKMAEEMKWFALKDSSKEITEDHFWTAIEIWKQNIHVVNRRVCSIVQIYEENLTAVCHQHIEEIILNCHELGKKALLKDNNLVKEIIDAIDVKEESELNIQLSVRKVLPRNIDFFHECLELVLLDMISKTATFMNLTRVHQCVLPQIPYRISYHPGRLFLKVLLQHKDSDQCFDWLKSQLLPRLEKWAKRAHSSDDTTTKTITQSLCLVNTEEYNSLYQSLKRKYGQEMVKVWPECTDPAKFVYEDVAIAAYLLLLWKEENIEKCSFVDLGCGNGLLVHILNSEGHNGVGLDVRERKIWSMYPSTTKLKVETIIPSEKTLFPEADWLIGNHSDELTPWIPVIAARSSPRTRYFVLPCCSYEFDGRKFNRRVASSSQYQSYLDYVKRISEECGFDTAVDRLRIPSTKRICLVGRQRTYNDNEWMIVNERITDIIRQGCLNETNDINDNEWVADFKPREKEEKVRNCTKISRSLQDSIVTAVVTKLLSDKCLVKSQREPSKMWNAGGSLLMEDVVKLVTLEQLKCLKSECGGLQTLLRNHHQIFKVEKGRVQLRLPQPKPEPKNDRPSASKKQRIGTKPCWFLSNHPDGCLLADEVCCFAH